MTPGQPNHRRGIRRGRGRRAFTLLESIVAASLLGLLMACVGSFVVRVRATETAAEERRRALAEVENRLEEALASALRGEPPAAAEGDADPGLTLRDARLTSASGEADDLGLRSWTVTLTWRNPQGELVRPVSLTGWIPAQSPADATVEPQSSPDDAPAALETEAIP
ncbi:MAG: type II secretion system protein [Planctomyces sp.]|nr:type II secretion system protein [Planctomyces sp.]